MENKIFLGTINDYEREGSRNDAYLTISFTNGEFSASGEVWQHSRRDIVTGGQCLDALKKLFPNNRTMAQVYKIWKKYHLNHMRAGCEHQRSLDVSKKVEVVTYGLTYQASRLRTDSIKKAAKFAAKGEPAPLSNTEKALILLDNWFEDVFTPPDADSPLSGCYEVKKREQKAIGWIKPSEHPEGLLCKPCDVCGYKYGSAWLKEEIPAHVQSEIRELMQINKKKKVKV